MTALTDQLATRLGWAERRIELPPGRYETILPPGPVADLMIYLYWTMEARDADEGRNVFARPGGGNRVGERLSTLPLTLRSDPAAPGLETAPFQVVAASSGAASVFDNGLAAPAIDWIELPMGLAAIVRSVSVVFTYVCLEYVWFAEVRS